MKYFSAVDAGVTPDSDVFVTTPFATAPSTNVGGEMKYLLIKATNAPFRLWSRHG
jgi:hypothetical protein